MGKSLPAHLNEVEVLQKAYGDSVVAKLLDKSERAIQYWFEQPERSPRRETLRTLHELFERHSRGEDLARADQLDSYKDKYISLLEKYTATQEINSSAVERLVRQNQALLLTVQTALSRLLSKAEKKTVQEITEQLDKENLKSLEEVGSLPL